MWEEVCAWLNEEFGRSRSVQMCYLKARANDAFAYKHVATVLEDPETAAAHVDGLAPESSRSQSASQTQSPNRSRSASTSTSSIFRLPEHPNAHIAFGNDIESDVDSSPVAGEASKANCLRPLDVIEVIDLDTEPDDGELQSDEQPTPAHAAPLQKQQWAPLGPSKPLLQHPQVL